MKIIFASLLIFAGLSAYAADYTAGTKCPTGIEHKPMDNVEYQAGKNASGYAVAPADIVPAPISADDLSNVKLPLNVPVADYIDKGRGSVAADKPFNVNGERLELQAGEVAIDAKSGDVTFNGRDISAIDPETIDPDCWK